MATNSDCSSLLSSASFQMPSLPSVGADEESFVVLWKDVARKSIDGIDNKVKTTDAAEAKAEVERNKLQNTNSFDNLSLSDKFNPETENNGSLDNANKLTEKEIAENTQSSIFQNMPVETGINTPEIISIITLPNDLTSEEIQKKVLELIEENIRLKDIILQNNATMKSQYKRITAWQEDVEKVHQVHKTKIIEAKEFIERLKKENHSLTRELKLMEVTNNELRGKAETLELAVKNMCTENATQNTKMEQLKNEIDRLETALHFCKTEIEMGQEELIKTKSVHEGELKHLNKVIDHLKSQQNYTCPSTDEVIKTALYAQIENLNKEILELRMELNTCHTQKDEIFALKAQLQLYKTDFETEKSAKEAMKMEKAMLLEDVKKLQGVNKQLNEKIDIIRENYHIIPKAQVRQNAPSDEECVIQ